MSFWKHSLVAAGIFFGIAATVTYSSCTNDSCKTLMCRNGGTCADEACRCPDGFEGAQCEVLSNQKFRGKYDGIIKINSLPSERDSAIIDILPERDTSKRGIYVTIYSRLPEKIRGYVLKNDVSIISPTDKFITFKMVGENKIEVFIDEVVNGERRITNFQGTKR